MNPAQKPSIQTGGRDMQVINYELKQAARSIVGQPGFSLLLVGVLSMGLACVIFMLIAIGSLVLRPLPFAEPENLVHIGLDSGRSRIGRLDELRSEDLIQIRRHLDGLAEVSAFQNATVNLSDLDRPQRFDGAFVTGNLFKVLGVAPVMGRDFNLADEARGAPTVVMLSDSLWRSRYGSDPGIVGRQVRVNAKPATIIGVMPRDFSYPRREVVWVPAHVVQGSEDQASYALVARRSPQANDTAIDTALQAWFADARRAEPEHFSRARVASEPLAFLTVHAGTRGVLNVMLISTLLVLLVACANAANLLLTRALGRRHELAIRVALGANRRRLILHLLAQSLLLTLFAAGVALVLASLAANWTDQAFRTFDDGPPLWIHFSVDARVVFLTLAVALFTGLVAGLLPAMRAGSAAMAGDLRDSARNTGGMARVSRALMVGEIALSLTLLIAVGSVIRGVMALDRSDLGIDPAGILTARVGLFESSYPTGADQVRLFERITDRLRSDPEVIDATAATNIPGVDGSTREYLTDGDAADNNASLPLVNFAAVDDGFFSTYNIRLVEGRDFDSRDSASGTPVAIVDQSFATRHAKDGSVIGRRFRLDPTDVDGPTVTIVGVISRLWLDRPGDPIRPSLIVPLRQQPARFVSLAIRVKDDPAAFAPKLAEHVREVDADTPTYWVRTYDQVIREATFDQRLLARMFGAFGIVALILAAAGVYGVIAFNVGQRTREIGVRRALGASSRSVLGQVLGRAGWLVAAGLAMGLGFGLTLARALNSTLHDIPSSGVAGGESISAVIAVAVLLVAAFIAVVLPARRALRVDPMIALRHE
jgi:putative ABC transport system permease protein